MALHVDGDVSNAFIHMTDDENIIEYVPNLEGFQLEQDPGEPVWESVMLDYASDPNDDRNMHDLNSFEPVRSASGALDYGHAVRDENADPNGWMQHVEHGQPPRFVGQSLNSPAINVKVAACNDFRVTTFSVDNAVVTGDGGRKMVMARKDRKRVVITNLDAAANLFYSHQPINPPTAPLTYVVNGGMIKAGTSRELQCWGDIYLAPAVGGTAQLVEVYEEFFLDGRDG